MPHPDVLPATDLVPAKASTWPDWHPC
jgi:hypothetical protein